jgi:signal transduction histidine kinase
MNKKWFFGVSLSLVILFSFANVLLSDRLAQRLSERTEIEAQSIFRLQANVLADLVRNDLLAGNFREARNKMSRASVRSFILGCELRRNDGFREQLFGAEPGTATDSRQFEVPVYFSDMGPAWGTLVFYLNTQPLSSSLAEINKNLALNHFALTALLILVLIALLGFFWRTCRSLERWFEFSLQGLREPGRSYFYLFWLPMIRRIEAIADQFKAVELVIEKIEANSTETVRLNQLVHDIKSPLSAINLGASKLVEGPAADLVKVGAKRISEIVKAAVSAKRTSKGDPGSNVVTADLLQLIRELLPELRSQDETAEIEILGNETGAYVSAVEPDMLRNIVANLVQNSIEASREKPEIRLVLRASKNFNFLIVSDKGEGIPDSILGKIGLVPISHKPAIHENSGSGQGLYGAFRTIRSWGGEVKVSSKSGRGTQVVIALPRIEPPNAKISRSNHAV